MSSDFGTNIKISIFGESHGTAVGAVLDNLPAGEEINMEELEAFMHRRPGGNTPYSTPRKEADIPKIISGIYNGYTTGAPLCVIIENTNTRSQDYAFDIPRPGHADYPAYVKYNGFNDYRGGGHFSGRLTAPLCAAGGIVMQILRRRNVKIIAHIASIADIEDLPFDTIDPENWNIEKLSKSNFAVLSDEAGERMKAAVIKAKERNDSLGGIVECGISGLPVGIGGPLFGGLEGKISYAVFGIGAVKGIEFGSGFASASMLGSECNDPFVMHNGDIVTETNHHGGILGGMASGMPIIFRAAFKPTPSIATQQCSVSLSRHENTKLEIHGRHDPCIVPRAVVCVEAAAALAIADFIL